MSDVRELIHAVHTCGAFIRVEGPDLKIKPAGVLPADLKARLKEHKAEILRRLELDASTERLKGAGIDVAIWEDGSIHLLISEADTEKAIHDGGTIYTSRDMFMYVTLSKQERRMLHDFKRRFGGTVEWKES